MFWFIIHQCTSSSLWQCGWALFALQSIMFDDFDAENLHLSSTSLHPILNTDYFQTWYLAHFKQSSSPSYQTVTKAKLQLENMNKSKSPKTRWATRRKRQRMECTSRKRRWKNEKKYDIHGLLESHKSNRWIQTIYLDLWFNMLYITQSWWIFSVKTKLSLTLSGRFRSIVTPSTCRWRWHSW